jgi:hypothetical protein
MPAITAISIDDTFTITFTGEDFPTDYDGSVNYMGIDADSVSVDSSSQVTATFTKGVPIAQSEIAPELEFETDIDSDTGLANIVLVGYN